MSEHYGLACEALHLGRALLPQQPVVHFGEVSQFAMLEAADERMDLALLCVPKLYELWVADRHSDREMLRMLFCYVRRAKSVECASEELHIHRNTLLYRIKRMAGLAGLDLDDGSDLARILLTEDVIRYLNGRIPGE